LIDPTTEVFKSRHTHVTEHVTLLDFYNGGNASGAAAPGEIPENKSANKSDTDKSKQ